jgi:hypothetical protein
MEMIQHGWETLAALHRFRYLTSWQVAKLFFLGRPNLQGVSRGPEAARKAANERCLRRLKDRQLVETRQAMLTHGTSWRRQEYNVLTRADHLLLRDRSIARGETPPEWDPERATIAPEGLPHALALNDVAIALIRSCEHHGWRVLAWIDDFAARRALGQVRFEHFLPDAAALVAFRDMQALYFVELDRGTEPVASDAANSWRTKVIHYRQYLQHTFASDRFFAGFSAPLLLVVTTGSRRLAHLIHETDNWGPRDHSWFTRLEWIEPPFDILDAIWQRPASTGTFYSLQQTMALRSA